MHRTDASPSDAVECHTLDDLGGAPCPTARDIDRVFYTPPKASRKREIGKE